MRLTTIQQCFVILLIWWFLSSLRSISAYGVYLKDSNNQLIRLFPNHRVNTETNSTNSIIHDSRENEEEVKESHNVEQWSIIFEYVLISCCFLFILGTTLIGILQRQTPTQITNCNLFNTIQSNTPSKSHFNSSDHDFVEVAIFPFN